jgi:SAM-dependent methyltransferase
MIVAAPLPPAGAWLRATDGELEASGKSWMRPATASDELALRRVVPPVLDIGCGPGRHVVALAEQGIPALGIDITSIALSIARARGALVLERCVFDRVPAAGRWRSALLLDGNLGIGGDPLRLLRRVTALLCPGARVIVELAGHDTRVPVRMVRLELPDDAGPWFRWARVTAGDLADLAARTGHAVVETWRSDDGRSFACLETPTRERR